MNVNHVNDYGCSLHLFPGRVNLDQYNVRIYRLAVCWTDESDKKKIANSP